MLKKRTADLIYLLKKKKCILSVDIFNKNEY